jgi:predicted anti-sigma-YlaC factor YlaD
MLESAPLAGPCRDPGTVRRPAGVFGADSRPRGASRLCRPLSPRGVFAPLPALAGLLFLALFAGGCSIRSMAVNAMARSMQESSVVYARDDDPELVEDAMPFLLKTVEGLLEEKPDHAGLLLTACQGFTSYAQAFIAVPADVVEEADLDAARAQRERASRMFVRARGYGLRALELAHPGIGDSLTASPERALSVTKPEDVPVLYWLGASWAGAINVGKSNMELMADLGVANAILQRANALDADWNEGAIHEVLISLEAALSGGYGGSIEAAREHFQRALELSHGERLGPFVSLAEAVCIKEQNVTEFQSLLHQALAIDLDQAPDYRLANTLARRRAVWLLEHTEDFFIDYVPEEEGEQ